MRLIWISPPPGDGIMQQGSFRIQRLVGPWLTGLLVNSNRNIKSRLAIGLEAWKLV